MRIAILSDIHGNLAALNRVLKCISENFSVDRYINLGDAIGYFPESTSIYNRLADYGFHSLLGNHEAMLLNYVKTSEENLKVYRLNEIRDSIDHNVLTSIKILKPYYELKIHNLNLLFVHGSPFDPLNGRIYPDTNIDSLVYDGIDYVFMGHTHYPLIKKIKEVNFINVGSVGLPRDNGLFASFCILDTMTRNTEIFRIELDFNELIDLYGDFIHEDVKSIFFRKKNKTVIGDIIKW